MSEREAVDEAAGQCDGRRDKAAGGEDQSNKEYVLGHVDLAGPFVQPYVAIAGGRGERGLPRLPSGKMAVYFVVNSMAISGGESSVL